MQRFVCGLWIVTVLGSLLATTAMQADEQNIGIDKLPKAVVDAVKAKYPDAKLVAAEKETQKDKTFYEVMIKSKGRDIELLLTPEGKLVSVEQKIDAAALPKAVAHAVKTKYAKSTIKAIEETVKGDKATYAVLLETEVMIDKEKQKVQVQLTADGKITATQQLIAARDLPKAVTDSLEKQYPKAAPVRVNEITKEDKTTYLVLLESTEKKIMAVLNAEGKILKDVSQDKKPKK